jgi:hypothetical protein
VIDNLEPGTVYYYELTATDVRGQSKVVGSASFTTKGGLSTNAPINVRQFTAKSQSGDVALSWVNTFTDSTSVVRIVRSHLFYPTTIDDGAVVYQGRGESFLDTGALRVRSSQYYTIFVIDQTGRVSSGAVAVAFSTDAPTTAVTTPRVPPPREDFGDPKLLSTADVLVLQGNNSFGVGESIRLDKNVPYLIRIPYRAVAPNLKSIIVSVQNPTNQREVSAYLLKLNPAGDAYEALVAPPNVVGTALLTIEVFDYEQATVRRITTSITFVNEEVLVPFFPDRLLQYMLYLLLLFAALTFSYWLLPLWRRRNKKDNS